MTYKVRSISELTLVPHAGNTNLICGIVSLITGVSVSIVATGIGIYGLIFGGIIFFIYGSYFFLKAYGTNMRHWLIFGYKVSLQDIWADHSRWDLDKLKHELESEFIVYFNYPTDVADALSQRVNLYFKSKEDITRFILKYSQ